MGKVTVLQDEIFLKGEGDSWFNRNSAAIESKLSKFDWPTYLIDLIEDKNDIRKVAELGCSNGWRLQKLSEIYPEVEFYGCDPSMEAIESGRLQYPKLKLLPGVLSDVPFQEQFDIVIVFGVFCWVDRASLARSFAEVDRVVKDHGFLVIGDFLPDYPQRRSYDHLAGANVYTYKQNYPAIFESLGLYHELAKFSNDYTKCNLALQTPGSAMRWSCSILQKSLTDFYSG